MESSLKIFSGRSNEPFAQRIVDYLSDVRFEIDVGHISMGRLDPRRNFSDGELYAGFAENIRGKDVFIVQSTNQPDTHILELETMIKTARMSSASRITAVIPYYGYARQDWKDKPRAPVTAAFIARDLWSSSVDRVLLLDVHSNVTLGAFAALLVPTDHLWAKPLFLKYCRENQELKRVLESGAVIAGPDIHAGKFARGYAEAFDVPLVLVDKRRSGPNKSEVLNVIGEVEGRNVLIVDDMIDTAGTLCNAADAFREKGAKRILALATHGVFSGEAFKRVRASKIERIFVTDSIFRSKYPSKIRVVSVAELLGEAIFRIHVNQSVSSLFEES